MFNACAWHAHPACALASWQQTPCFCTKERPQFTPMIPCDVYSPGEDTYTLIDALEKNMDALANKVILEVGCGSGEVLRFLEKSCRGALLVGTDTNDRALAVSCMRAESCSYILVDLLCCFNQELVDVVVFNPPYVETEATGGSGISLCYSGGKSGRAVIDRFVGSVEVPVVFLLLTRKNMPADVIRALKSRGYASAEVVEKRRVLGETLVVIRAEKQRPLP